MDAFLGAGIAEGAAKTAAYNDMQPERQARLREAQLRQQKAQIELDEFQQNAPTRQTQEQLQLQQTQADVQKMQAQLARDQAFQAFRMYGEVGDTKVLNNLLTSWKNNPMAKSIMGNVVRVDPVSEQDADTLRRIGVTDIQGYLSNNPGNLVKVTNADGSQQLIDMQQVYAGTGYTQFMDDQELERQARRALITSRMRQGTAHERLSSEERIVQQFMEQDPNLTWTDAYRKLMEMKNGGNKGTTETERLAKKLQAEAAANGEEIDDIDAYNRAIQMSKSTSKQKDLGAAEDAKTALDEAFGGDYFGADMSDPATRRKAEPYVRRIEQLSDAKLPLATQKRLTEIRQLITLGKAGSELTAAETGPIDSLLRDAKKYISDDVQGTAATSAYEAYRNLVRNALFGASLTNNETAAFNKAFGTLGEQTGPVLAKLRTQTQMLKDELEGIYYQGDEYVTKFRTGMDMDRLTEVLYQLDERLALFDKVAPEGEGEMPTGTLKKQTAPAPTQGGQPKGRKSLEELFQ